MASRPQRGRPQEVADGAALFPFSAAAGTASTLVGSAVDPFRRDRTCPPAARHIARLERDATFGRALGRTPWAASTGRADVLNAVALSGVALSVATIAVPVAGTPAKASPNATGRISSGSAGSAARGNMGSTSTGRAAKAPSPPTPGTAVSPQPASPTGVGRFPASPDERAVCAARHFESQQHVRDGKLLAAKQLLPSCIAESCPSVIRQDCGDLLKRLDTEIPTLVLAVSSIKGNDIVNYTLEVDGQTVRVPSGKSIDFDPGVHRLRVVAPGHHPLTTTIEVRVGEHLRRVPVQLTPLSPPKRAPAPTRRQPPPLPVWPGYALGGLGAASLFGGIVLGLGAHAEERSLRSGCAPDCGGSQVDALERRYLFANVALAAGAVGLVGGLSWWWFTAGRTSTTVALTPVVGETAGVGTLVPGLSLTHRY